MKILQFVADGSPGGGTTHVLQILGHLRQRANFCVALLTEANSYLAHRAQQIGIPTYGGQFIKSRVPRMCRMSIRDAVASFSPDLIHCHGGRANFFIACDKKMKIPTVYTVHGFHHRKKPFVQRMLGGVAERFGIEQADKVVFVCHHDREVALRERLMNSNKSNQVIYNGIHLPEQLNPRSASWNGRLGFIGRLVEQKHPQLFLRIITQLETAEGIIAGGGELDSKMRSLAEELRILNRVHFLGVVTREEVVSTLATLDVLIMTSRWEGLPILPLESMWMGVPVVSTNVGGMREIIEHGKSGFLIEGDSPAQFVDVVNRLSKDASLRNSVCAAAKEKVLSLFSEDVMIRQIFDLYTDVVRDPHVREPMGADQI